MLTYTLKKTPGHPLYEQLYQSIRDDIAAGRLEPAEMPHAETLEIMRQMDTLRAAWQIRYPFE